MNCELIRSIAPFGSSAQNGRPCPSSSLCTRRAQSTHHCTTAHASPPAAGGAVVGSKSTNSGHKKCRTVFGREAILDFETRSPPSYFVKFCSPSLLLDPICSITRRSTQHGGFAMDGCAKAARMGKACGHGLSAGAWRSFGRTINGMFLKSMTTVRARQRTTARDAHKAANTIG